MKENRKFIAVPRSPLNGDEKTLDSNWDLHEETKIIGKYGYMGKHRYQHKYIFVFTLLSDLKDYCRKR